MATKPGYYQNSNLTTPPVGSIMEYLGTNDPDGWIICNGTARTNNQDGRYNALSSLGIGSGGSGTSNYTPPNLQNKFAIGASTTYTLNSTGGNASKTLGSTELPSHSHVMRHQHYAGANWGAPNNTSYTNNYRIETAVPIEASTGFCVDDSTHGVVTSGSTVVNTTSSGGTTSIPTIPPYLAVNYIIKY